MYVCICNRVTESQLRNEIAHGLTTVPQLRASLGVTKQCGKCLECVKACLPSGKQKIDASAQLLSTSFCNV